MKTVILAGGQGTRIPEYTKKIPKPMIKVGGAPLLTHIMKFYQSYGFNEFIIAVGYKGHIIKNYYKNSKEFKNLKVVDTGNHTMTGGRILRLKKLFSINENFFLTYGDGLSNVNLKKLLNFHVKSKKIATLTAVHPPVRFGELKIRKNNVLKFEEKPESISTWINGGFFVLNYKIFKSIRNDQTIFEKSSLELLTKKKNLAAFKHNGFWKCMDNLGDKNFLEKLFKQKTFKWNK
jgi:glucose-1-phosphate cytidylyltransferase